MHLELFRPQLLPLAHAALQVRLVPRNLRQQRHRLGGLGGDGLLLDRQLLFGILQRLQSCVDPLAGGGLGLQFLVDAPFQFVGFRGKRGLLPVDPGLQFGASMTQPVVFRADRLQPRRFGPGRRQLLRSGLNLLGPGDLDGA